MSNEEIPVDQEIDPEVGDEYYVVFLSTGDRAYVHDPRSTDEIVGALVEAKKTKRLFEIGSSGEEAAFDHQAVAGVAPAESGAIDEVWRYQVQQDQAEQISTLKAEADAARRSVKDKIKARSR